MNVLKCVSALREQASRLSDGMKLDRLSGTSMADSVKNAHVQLSSERGAISTGWLEGLFVGIILLVVLITFLWQTGIPMVIEATSNTTALTNAGATASQVSWATFIGGAIVIFIFVGALIMGIRIATGGGGGGGGGGRKRRRKK